MTAAESLYARLAIIGDRFLPPGLNDPDAIRRTRAALLQSGLGLFFTIITGSLYAAFGSPWSGAAIHLISLGLVATPLAIRRRASTLGIANSMLGLTYCATFVVACRSGGFASPAVAWCFLFPLMAFIACGLRWVAVWGLCSSLQIAFFFIADLEGVSFAQDFTPRMVSVLRVSGYAGVILAILLMLLVIESVRVHSQRALDAANRMFERERIFQDMHDGLGSQLLGLSLQARAGQLEPSVLASGLENCLDDLRLIVDSLDPLDRPLETALGELRARTQPRCDAAGVALTWRCDLGGLGPWSSSSTLQLLRALQELLSNALRHAHATRIEVAATVSTTPTPRLRLCVTDNGVGFDPTLPRRHGRGLKNLQARAQRLRGALTITPAEPGTHVELSCPTDPVRWPESPGV